MYRDGIFNVRLSEFVSSYVKFMLPDIQFVIIFR